MVVNKTDIAIIGGGVQGLFLAYYAKKKFPRKSVSLFESDLIGWGITKYSAHLHTPYGTGKKHDLARQSLALYEALRAEYRDFPMEEKPFTGVCNRDNINTVVRGLTGPYTLLDTINYPFAKLPISYVFITDLRSYVTGRNLADYLLQITARLGLKIFEGITITNVERISNGYQLMKHTHEPVYADVVFNCSGKEIIHLLEDREPQLRTKKVIALHIDGPILCENVVYYFFDDDAFLLPDITGGRYLFSYRCNEWDIDNRSTPRINEVDLQNAKSVLDIYTKDFSKKVLGAQVNVDVYNTPSTSPLICKIDTNYYVVGATGGSGIRLAPALAVNTLNQMAL